MSVMFKNVYIFLFIIYLAQCTNYSDIHLGMSNQLDGVVISGVSSEDLFGLPVRSAGDINGDGFNDFLIGAAQFDINRGVLYVIFGGKEPLSSIDLSSGLKESQGFCIIGSAQQDYLGSSASRAGDLNGDGIEDLILGAYNAKNNAGAAYVIFGRKGSWSNITLSSGLDPSQGFAITGSASSQFGISVSRAGDFNGDGIDDIMAASYTLNQNAGAVYVFYGRKGSFSNITLSNGLDPSQGFIIFGPSSFSYFGYSLDCAGDVNGDNIDDIVIGAFTSNGYRGTAYVFFGKKVASRPNIILSSGFDGNQGFAIIGNNAGDYMGTFVAGAGDVNNDQVDDVVIGAPFAFSLKGAVFVIFGSKNGFSNITANPASLDPKIGFSVLGNIEDGRIGLTVSRAGDINRDGASDIIIGASNRDMAYVIFGGSNSRTLNLSQGLDPQQGYTIYSASQGDNLGISLSNVGDVNNDKVDDIMLGAKNAAYFLFSPFVCQKGCQTCTTDKCLKCEDGYGFRNSICVECSSSTKLVNGVCITSTEEKNESGLNSAAETTKKMLDTSSVASRAVSMGSSVSVGLGLIAKIIQNVRFLNISYPQDAESAFQSYGSELFDVSVPTSFYQGTETKNLSSIYMKYDLQPSFLENYLQNIILISASLGLFIVFKLIQCSCCLKKNPKIQPALKIAIKVSLNFAVIQVYSSLDDIVFFCILEWSSTKFSSAFAVISTASAIIFLVLGISFLCFNYWVLCRYQSIKKSPMALEAFKKRFEVVGTFFEDFKDHDLFQQSFFALFIIRCVAFIMIIALARPPLIQAILMMTINIFFVIYLIAKRPFNDLFNEITQYFGELAVFVAYACVLVLAILDYNQNSADGFRNTLGKCIVLSGTVLSLGGFIIQMIQIGLIIYQAIKSWKNHPRRRKKVRLSSLINTTRQSNLSSCSFQDHQLSRRRVKIETLNSDLSMSRIKSDGGSMIQIFPEKLQQQHSELEISEMKNESNNTEFYLNERTRLKDPITTMYPRRKILRKTGPRQRQNQAFSDLQPSFNINISND